MNKVQRANIAQIGTKLTYTDRQEAGEGRSYYWQEKE
jgi:hypothetical protein